MKKYLYHMTCAGLAFANPLFANRVQQEVDDLRNIHTLNEFDERAAVLDELLTYVYAGKQNIGWEFFDRSYTFEDKAEIRRRVKAILLRQPVYKSIYNNKSYKS
jgi:hypothetical protein